MERGGLAGLACIQSRQRAQGCLWRCAITPSPFGNATGRAWGAPKASATPKAGSARTAARSEPAALLSNVLKTMKCLLYLSASRLLAAWSTLLADGAPALCLTASRYRSSDVHRHGSAHSRVRSLDANRVDDGFGRDARSQFGNFLFAAGGCIVDVKSRGVGWMWSEKKRTGCEKAVREGERGGW